MKFIESIILLQTSMEPDSVKREGDFCLDDVPINVKVARPRKLEEDARYCFIHAKSPYLADSNLCGLSLYYFVL